MNENCFGIQIWLRFHIICFSFFYAKIARNSWSNASMGSVNACYTACSSSTHMITRWIPFLLLQREITSFPNYCRYPHVHGPQQKWSKWGINLARDYTQDKIFSWGWLTGKPSKTLKCNIWLLSYAKLTPTGEEGCESRYLTFGLFLARQERNLWNG